jgi:peptidoglycan hydrolase-like protein with peptidoglycan-binding domain
LPVAQAPAPELARTQPRVLTRDEVRQLQLRLKNAGFDPGPVDGVAGTRTKAAFNGYYAGCAQVKPLLSDFDDAGAPATSENAVSKPLDHHRTQAIQNQLRAAGFDPGPADGIFGAKTKRTLAQVKSNCRTINELAAALNESVAGADNKSVVGQAARPSDGFTTVHSSTTLARVSVTPRAPTAAPVGGAEEVRILQLRLRDAGFDPGPFDGVMGPKTRSALQQYEASQRSKKVKASLTTNIHGQY